MSRKPINFNGIKYYYMKPYYRSQWRSGIKSTSLHRAIWVHHHGEIPNGMLIHHIDHDRVNNDISNLQMMTPREHTIHHKGNP
jgi:hypothetical protein